MTSLVRDLLDYASMEAGRFSINLQTASARSLVAAALDHTRVLAEAKSQTIHATIASNEPAVSCDVDRVIQVLVNLVDNAIKFSPKGGDINITVDDADGWVRFADTDMGPGSRPTIPSTCSSPIGDRRAHRRPAAPASVSSSRGRSSKRTAVKSG